MQRSIDGIAGRRDGLDFFWPLIIGEECEHGKPWPDPYLAAMKALGVDAASCIAFEVSRMQTLAVRHG